MAPYGHVLFAAGVSGATPRAAQPAGLAVASSFAPALSWSQWPSLCVHRSKRRPSIRFRAQEAGAGTWCASPLDGLGTPPAGAQTPVATTPTGQQQGDVQ